MISGVQSSRFLGLLAAPREGMRSAERRLTEAAEAIAGGDVSPDNVVGLVEAEAMFKANAAVARTHGRMIGTLLNTLA